ncbi:MAG: T9SS type A sorting domain-containing protein [Balneola sp.]|nr:T9SS type A sorting domain-containing protein [Balneola sp.]
MKFLKNISFTTAVLLLVIISPGTLVGQSITAATGGSGISADNVGGAYTSLTGPVITEASAGQISLGFIDFTVPSGFEWNTGATPTVTVTLAPGLNGKTKLQASFISISSTVVRVEVTQTSDNGGNRAGRITIGNLQVRPTSGVFPNSGNITNTGTTAPAGTTNYGSLSIVKGAASQVRVETASDGTGSVVAAQDLTAGNSLTVYSISRDQFGNFLSNVEADTWSITNSTGDVESTDLTNQTNSTSTTLSSNLVGSGNIQASEGALTPVTSGTITVVHSTASALVIGTEPSSTATAGTAFAQQPVVNIVDVFGNIVTSDNSTQITAARSLGTGDLQGTTTKTVVSGVATFTNLSHNVANSIEIQFSAVGFSSIHSAQIDVSAAAASALEFSVQPPNGSKNNTLAPSPEVQIIDVYGNDVSQSGTTIDLIASVSNSFSNSSTTSVSTNASGTAIFDDLAFKTNGTYTIQAEDNLSALTPVTSDPFSIVTSGTLSNFVIEISGGGSIPSQTAGTSFTIDITAVDGTGSTLNGLGGRDDFNGKAYITVPGNTGTGINDSTISFSSGEASHTLTLETAGNFSISASRNGISTPSNAFDVDPGAAAIATSELEALPPTIVANGSSTSLITVRLKDAYGNFLDTGGDAVVISSTAGTLLSSVTDNSNGSYEQFLQSSTTVDSAFISATVNAATITAVDTVVFVHGGLDKFAVEAAGGGTIGTQTAGSSFDILITAQDVNGNTVTSFNGNVSLTANKIASSGTGTLSLSSGVLDNHTITLTESGIADATITATNSAGSQSGSSNAFTINPGTVDPTTTTITPANRFIENTGSSTTLITVQAKDQYGNNLLTGGETVTLITTSGTLQGSVSDNSNGTYTQTLQSSIIISEATISGLLNASSISDDAKVYFTEFNEWTSSGGGGSNPSNWSRSSNWTLGTPTSTQAVIIPTNPTGATKFPILDTSPTIAFLEIESGASLNADPGFSITITGSVSGDGSLILDNATSTIGGDISIANLNAGNSTVELNGTDEQIVDGDIVSNILTISNSGSGVTVNGYINADTQLEVESGSTLNLATGSTMEIFGDLIGAGTLNTSNSDILIGGDISLSNANFSTSDVELNGLALQTVDSEFTYQNLSVTNTSGAGVTFQNNSTVNNTLSLTSGSTIQVNGNLTANTLVASGATVGISGNLDVTNITSAPSTVEFNGTSDQNLSDFDQFTNLTINKSSGELIANTDVDVSGTLTLTQGDLVIGSGHNLLAPTRTITSGQIRFLRELTSQGWYLISSPVAATFDNLLDSVVTQGYTGSTLGNAPLDSLQPNVLYYDETFTGTDLQRWRAPGNASDNVAQGVGYFVYVFGDIAADTRYNNPLPDTLDVGGTEFTGSGSSVDFGITYTASADTGWNLVGNPYGATLDWDDSGNWTKTNVDNTIYVWDKTANGGNGEYLVWNGLTGSLGDGLIAPFQGFWVKANASSPSLIVDTDVKTNGGVFYKTNPEKNDPLEEMRTSPVLGFELTTNGLRKESFIMFSEQGLVGKDPFDAYQLVPFTDSYLELYTKHKDGSPLVINHLPRKFGKEIEIPIYIDAYKNGTGYSGSFSLNLNTVKNIPEGWSFNLQDVSTGIEKSLEEGEVLNFSFRSSKSKTASGTGLKVKQAKNNTNPHFILKIQPGDDASGIPSQFNLKQNYPNPFNPSTTFAFDLPVQSPVTLEVYDILGRKITSVIQNKTYQAGSHDITWDASSLASGIYLYRILTSEGSSIKRMTLIK